MTAGQLAALLNACYEDYATPIRFHSGQFDFFVRSHDVLPDALLVASELNFLFATMTYQVVLRQNEMTLDL